MQIINIDLIPGKVMPVLHSSQYDKGRELGVKLYNGGAVFTLSGAETVTVSVRKPDGNIVIETLTNTGTNELTIITTEQMTACHGSNLCEIKIEDGADVIGTANFVLEVEKDPTEGGIASASEIDNLEAQVAAIVADQYDSANVVFDATPTAGHGVGFAVTSEGVLNAIPDEINDLGDVDINAAAIGEALVWDGSKWVNGTVSTVGSIDDLNDVDTTGKAEGDSLRYDSGSSEWVAKPIVIEVTQAEYDQLVLDGDLQPLTTYVLTDAPNLNATSEDLSYDGGATSTHDVIEGLTYNIGDTVDLSSIWCAGYQGNNTTRIFFIPLSKPIASGANVSLSNVVVSAYSMSGASETWNNVNIANMGTVTLTKTSSGILVSVVMSTAVTTTLYTPLTMRIISGSLNITA